MLKKLQKEHIVWAYYKHFMFDCSKVILTPIDSILNLKSETYLQTKDQSIHKCIFQSLQFLNKALHNKDVIKVK